MYVVPPISPARGGGGGGGGIMRAIGMLDAIRDRREQQARQEEIAGIVRDAGAAGGSPSEMYTRMAAMLARGGHYDASLQAQHAGTAAINAAANTARLNEPASYDPLSIRGYGRALGFDPENMTPEQIAAASEGLLSLQPEPEPRVPGDITSRVLAMSPEDRAEWIALDQQINPGKYGVSTGGRRKSGTAGTGAGGGAAAAGAPSGTLLEGVADPFVTTKTASGRDLQSVIDGLARDPNMALSVVGDDALQVHAYARRLQASGTNPVLASRLTSNLPLLPHQKARIDNLLVSVNALGIEDLTKSDDPTLKEAQKSYRAIRKHISPHMRFYYDPKFGISGRAPTAQEATRPAAPGRVLPGADPTGAQVEAATARVSGLRGAPAAAPAAAPEPAPDPSGGGGWGGILSSLIPTMTWGEPSPDPVHAPRAQTGGGLGMSVGHVPGTVPELVIPEPDIPEGVTMAGGVGVPTGVGGMTPAMTRRWSRPDPLDPFGAPGALQPRRVGDINLAPGDAAAFDPPGIWDASIGAPTPVTPDAAAGLGPVGGIADLIFRTRPPATAEGVTAHDSFDPLTTVRPTPPLVALGDPGATPAVTPAARRAGAGILDSAARAMELPGSAPEIEAREILEILPSLPKGSEAYDLARERYLELRPELGEEVRKVGDKAFRIRARNR